MHYQIEVEIDGQKYIPVLPVTAGAAGQKVFTTISDNQSRVIITLFLCVLTEDYILTFRALSIGRVRGAGAQEAVARNPEIQHLNRIVERTPVRS